MTEKLKEKIKDLLLNDDSNIIRVKGDNNPHQDEPDTFQSVEAKDHFRYSPYTEKEKENMWKMWKRLKSENPSLTWEEFKDSAEYRDNVREQEMIDREELARAKRGL